MSNLLDKASIILTPTAYNNGEALCVKPSDGSGDFDFSRNSAATRVNAQGLVENVQILSSNLVQNGDFSEEGAEEVSNGSFSQEGSELIVNGDFTNNINGWVSYASISTWDEGTIKTTCTSNTAWIRQNSVITANKYYKVTFKAKASNISQNIKIYNGAFVDTGLGFDAVDTYKEFTYYLYTNVTNIIIGQQSVSIGDTINFDNVSVREVGQDWTLGTGWSIGEDKAICDGTTANLIQSNVGGANKNFKLVFTISDYISGVVRPAFVGLNAESPDFSGNGTYTAYISSLTDLRLVFYSTSFNGSVTNISVKEVGMDWEIENTWTIGDGVANGNGAVGSTSELTQTPVNTIGKTYKATFEVLNYVSGTVGFWKGSGVTVINRSADGIYTEYFTATSAEIRFRPNNFNGSITNISVIEITDDTNLPRINYEGFSYQDALGSELVVNGNFDTDSDWTKGSGWTISGGSANYDGLQAYQLLRQGTANGVIGKTFLVKYDVSNNNGTGGIYAKFGGVSLSGYNTDNGSFEFYVEAISTDYIRFTPQLDFTGSIDNVSVKEVLGQEVVPNSGCGSWLFEPQSTNLVPYSEDFSNSYYAKSSVTLTSGFLAPDGSNNAYKVAGTIGSSYLGNLTANTHLRSIYVRTVSGTGQIKLIGSVDLFDVTEQWTRVSYNPQSSTYQFAVDFRGGTNISEVLIWGMQVEQQSYATSYIPTSGSTVTRNQDLCTNGGSLATINSTEGVLYAEISIDTTLGVGSDITLIDSSNTSDYIRFTNDGGTNKVNMYFRYNGVSNFHTFIGDTTIFKKYAIQWGNGEVNYYVNGVLKETDFTTMPSLNVFDKLHFSQTGSSNRAFTGNIKAVAVWKEALTAQELTELTTI